MHVVRQSLNRIDKNNMSAILCDIYEELNANTIDRIMMYLIIVYKVAQKLQKKLWEGWLNRIDLIAPGRGKNRMLIWEKIYKPSVKRCLINKVWTLPGS